MNIDTEIYRVPAALKAILAPPYSGPFREETVFNVGDQVVVVDEELLSNDDANMVPYVTERGVVVDTDGSNIPVLVEFKDGSRTWLTDTELGIYV